MCKNSKFLLILSDKNGENGVILHFFAEIFGHIKKKQYLCTRFRKEAMVR
jgi:hypothetical protein